MIHAAPFVVGFARSGTTLLRLMIDAHPMFAIPAETHFLPQVALQMEKVLPWKRVLQRHETRREEFIRILVTSPTWPDFRMSEDELRTELMSLRKFNVADGIRCFYRFCARRAGKPRWGDKTPGYSDKMSVIESLLPEAHFIHIIRDGRDVAVSIRHLWFRPGNDLTSMAQDWRGRIRATRVEAARVARYHELRYEDLVTEPERELLRVCEFLRVDYAPEMTRYWEGARERLEEVADRWNHGHLVTREQRLENQRWTNSPPEPARIGRWRSELSPEELAEYEAVAGDLLRELGYV